MVRLWALYNEESGIDDYIYINPLLVKDICNHGTGFCLISMIGGWYLVQGKAEDIARRIHDALKDLK